jgi:Arc/MetJ family transcription regulator
MAKQISKPDKTSMVIDREKAAEAKKILGTRTLAETVDRAFDEVISLAARRRLLERIEREGGLGPSPEELRRLRDPRA